jgi:signal transduction histidine kinase
MTPDDTTLAALAAHLAQRRAALLRAWRTQVTAHPDLTSGASLPRAQLHDHIPALLLDFEGSLGRNDRDGPQNLRDDAAAHGLHRWQQGFDLEEVARELGCLNEVMVAELEDYAAQHPASDPRAMGVARLRWARQCGTAISASTSQYFELQQMEARSHVKDLEIALESLRELEAQRAVLWQQAAHDLRGNLGVVANVTAGLVSPKADEVARSAFLRLLDRNVAALHRLLDDVTSLARLQGGQEQLKLEDIDAAAVLLDVCTALQPQAEERGLYLRFSGPPTLPVQGDAVKIRRVAQNLVLNAIKYTRQGGVSVHWGDAASADAARWLLEVQDTGPGFHAGPGAQFVGALEAATEQSKQVAADGRSGEVTHAGPEPAGLQRDPPDTRPVQQQAGEGIGLSIVKRLCELLNASIELDSTVDAGTRIRVLLPLRYED